MIGGLKDHVHILARLNGNFGWSVYLRMSSMVSCCRRFAAMCSSEKAVCVLTPAPMWCRRFAANRACGTPSTLAILLFWGFVSLHVSSDRSSANEQITRMVLVQASSTAIRGFTSAEMEQRFEQKGSCQLTISTPSKQSALFRFRDPITQSFYRLDGEIERLPGKMEQVGFWYPLADGAEIALPKAKVEVQVIRGLTTKMTSEILHLESTDQLTISVSLNSIYDLKAHDLVSGNTHLHLMRMTHREAIDYLQLLPKADDLDLVFLSHLRRIPDERHYISNQIVEEGLRTSTVRMVPEGTLFGLGEEHRHNFGRGGEGFGHVMLLDIVRLIRPVSIGPGIMAEGTDSVSLSQGIKAAKGDGATVVWCHNGLGFEDLSNHVLGNTDALNIFDGGNRGSYEQTYYRYYDLGLQLPISTGTDWFIYDFSRVHLPVDGMLTSSKWLASLRQGKSYITNGPMLEFTVNGQPIGATLKLNRRTTLKVKMSAVGRANFGGLELIHNGEVVATTATTVKNDAYTAEAVCELSIDEPSWVAVRISSDNSRTNLLGNRLFAHTSPVFVHYRGKSRFKPSVARQLLAEIQGGLNSIKMQARFGNDKEKEAVLSIYRQGANRLREMLRDKIRPIPRN